MPKRERVIAFARKILKGQEGYRLLPSKTDPRKRRWQRTDTDTPSPRPPTGKGSVLPPDWSTRLPERRRFEEFGELEPGGMGRNGPVTVGRLGDERWVLKPSNEGAVMNEIVASLVGRSLGLKVPPAIAVAKGSDLWAGSLLVDHLEHHPRVGFNDRNPLKFGPDGPEDIPNYWQQVGLGKLLGDIDRKGGNWGIDQYGQRWDFDFSLSENANLFYGPDDESWHAARKRHFQEAIEAMRGKLTPTAFRRYLEPYHTLAESDPERLYGWAGGLDNLDGLVPWGEPLGPALIEAGQANRRAMREVLAGLGLARLGP
ncbi:hypothetical protein [Calidithermus timidus]|jgi:hypothetical protein|uniref:hypothetical protein n=1 Tax=Calidithermus timidus TaxID=307124 RepID=UPI0003A83FFD|nr:hypothetical protein [Calidithermus timidus]